ncbi:MAG: hypothetical protein NT124_03840 [Candidatus Dependentiae bacterium]|nr:hypothetical protein [Candidatus Dependentiae bacterium]
MNDDSSVSVITGDHRKMVDTIVDECCIDRSLIDAVYETRYGYAANIQTILIPHLKIPHNQIRHKLSLAHEIMHILHSDVIYRKAIDSSLKLKDQHFVHKHNHFIEKRADILAALMNPDYAYQGYLEHTEFARKGHISAPSHPPHNKRAEYLKSLHTEMLCEKTTT